MSMRAQRDSLQSELIRMVTEEELKYSISHALGKDDQLKYPQKKKDDQLKYREISHALRSYLRCYGNELLWIRIYAADHPLWGNQSGLLTEMWDKDHELSTPIVFFTLINHKKKAFQGGTWHNKTKHTIGNFTIKTFYYKTEAQVRAEPGSPRSRAEPGLAHRRRARALPEFTLLEFVLENEAPNVAICVMHKKGCYDLPHYLYEEAYRLQGNFQQGTNLANQLVAPAQGRANIANYGEGSGSSLRSNNERQMYMTQIMNDGNTLGGNNASFPVNNNENYGYRAPQTPIFSNWTVNYRMDDTVPANIMGVPQDSYNIMQNQNGTFTAPIATPIGNTRYPFGGNSTDPSTQNENAMSIPYNGPEIEMNRYSLWPATGQIAFDGTSTEQLSNTWNSMNASLQNNNLMNHGYGTAPPAEFATPDYNGNYRPSVSFPSLPNNVPLQIEQYAPAATTLQDSYNAIPIQQSDGPELLNYRYFGQNYYHHQNGYLVSQLPEQVFRADQMLPQDSNLNLMLPEQGAHADEMSLHVPIMSNLNAMYGALQPLPESFFPYGSRHELSEFDEANGSELSAPCFSFPNDIPYFGLYD